ncbi:MAG: hypothetical protein HUJ31_13680, partial [Pseudomonadales bacterium]|nr:hypothetical protein [Pseudomonadales bacterium]
RVGYWRWVRFPAFFTLRPSSSATQFFIHWIDPEIREETLDARREGRSLEPHIEVYDQFREE